MITNPIIPVWVMVIICVFFLVLKRKGKANYIRQILIVALLFVINMRMMVRTGDVPTVMPKVDVLFVVDNTLSMLAEDYGPDDGRRIDAIKEDCKYIAEQLPGASISVVKFDNSVEMMIPYTADTNMAMETIGLLKGKSQYRARGTSLNDVMKALESMLDDKRTNYKIVFFISDGEVVSSEKLKSYSGLKKHVDGGAVLGYGTEKGGPMLPVEEYEDPKDATYLYYSEDYNQKLALSKIDEGNLKSIASDLGVDYVHMEKQSAVDGVLKKLQTEIDNLEVTEDTDSKEGYADIYYWFVIPLVLLLAWDFVSCKKRN